MHPGVRTHMGTFLMLSRVSVRNKGLRIGLRILKLETVERLGRELRRGEFTTKRIFCLSVR